MEDKRIGELLIGWEMVEGYQLDKALLMQKSSDNGKRYFIGELLTREGFAKEEDVVEGLIAQYRFPYIVLSRYSIDPELTAVIPGRVARSLNLMPVEKNRDSLSIAMSNPLDNEAISLVENVSNCNVQIFISTRSDINSAIDKYYGDS
jgi:type IV pilus assembly protein PilB